MKSLKLLVIFVGVVIVFVVALNWDAVFGPGEPEHPMDTNDDEVVAEHQKKHAPYEVDYASEQVVDTTGYYCDSAALAAEEDYYDAE